MDKEEENALMGKKRREFDDFFSALDPSEDRIGIVLHQGPDPDAMGAGMGLKWLMENRYGLGADVIYSGEISHPQNKTAVNVLNLRMVDAESADLDDYSQFVTVDCVPSHTNVIEEADVVIDHHDVECEAEFVDVRTTGSTCAIVWEYLDHFGFDFSSETGCEIATALTFGICSDTDNLFSDAVTDLDRRAHFELNEWIDRKKYRKIENFPLPSYLVDLKIKAANNRYEQDSVLMSGLGILSNKRRDALPIIADEYLQMQGVETVVVFALIDDYVQASVRSRNSSVNVPTFVEEIFGTEYAGGKTGAGGAKVPAGNLYSTDDDGDLREKYWEVVEKIIRSRVIKHVSGAEV